MLQFH